MSIMESLHAQAEAGKNARFAGASMVMVSKINGKTKICFFQGRQFTISLIATEERADFQSSGGEIAEMVGNSTQLWSAKAVPGNGEADTLVFMPVGESTTNPVSMPEIEFMQKVFAVAAR